jgi:hypothetical protein
MDCGHRRSSGRRVHLDADGQPIVDRSYHDVVYDTASRDRDITSTAAYDTGSSASCNTGSGHAEQWYNHTAIIVG